MKRIVFVSCLLPKAAAFFVGAVIIFNSILAVPFEKGNISPVADAQKDVFSAVMFVSDAIGKISYSFSCRISDRSHIPDNAAKKHSKNENIISKKSFVLIVNENRERKSVKNFYNLFLNMKTSYADFAVDKSPPGDIFRVDRRIIFVFFVLMIFYISSKRPKDASFNIYRRFLVY